MSEFANASCAVTNCTGFGNFSTSLMGAPNRLRTSFTFGSLGSLTGSWNAFGLGTSIRCFRPNAASPASLNPGFNLDLGSLASEPVIPAGNVGAGSGANGFDGDGEGDGDGDAVWAKVVAARHVHRKRELTIKRRAINR